MSESKDPNNNTTYEVSGAGIQAQPKSPVYIVQIILPSSNRTDGREQIDGQTDQIHYIFTEDMRKKISALRQRIRQPIFQELLDFPSDGESKVWFCNGDKVESIKQKMLEAEKEFQLLDSSLHTKAIFLPLNIHEIEAGDLYGQIMNAIRYRVLSEIINRIGEKAGQLPEKSKEAMLNLIEHMKSVNIFNDPEVTKHLAEIREKVLNQDIAAVKADLTKELDFTRNRMAYVNLAGTFLQGTEAKKEEIKEESR